MAELVAARDAVAGADMVELRLDGVAGADATHALFGRKLPAIVTCRAAWEGGRFDGSEEDRLRLLRDALRAGAEYVDVEWRADRRGFDLSAQSRLVLSHHDFSGTPGDLTDRVRAMRAEAAGTLKVAVTAGSARDCLLLREAVGKAGAHVAIAMGPAGRFTRAFPAWTRSQWTYTGTAAPGQFSTSDLVETFRVRETSASTRVFGIVGRPLGHSASPAMHNAAFRALGLDAVYLPIETADAEEFFEVADALQLEGASVTAPAKIGIAARCTEVDAIGRAVGAINTVKRDRTGWLGRNFDVPGFLAPLDRAGVAPAGSTALILGAGGAARGAAWALTARGVRVAIAARQRAAAEAVARTVGAEVVAWPGSGAAPDLLVNSTPVGAWPATGVSPVDSPRAAVAYDLVYNPIDTEFLTRARQAGARTIGGLDMLVEQAARQFEWWMGQTIARETLDRAARRFLGTLGS
jgi:3-dehydroquinate dehydratase/shikimate dehydrogenase